MGPFRRPAGLHNRYNSEAKSRNPEWGSWEPGLHDCAACPSKRQLTMPVKKGILGPDAYQGVILAFALTA